MARGEGFGAHDGAVGDRACSTTASAATTTRWPRLQQAVEHPREMWFSTWVAGRADRGGRPDRRASSARPTRWIGCRDAPAPAEPTGRWGSRRVRARCSATAMPPTASIARRSSGSGAPACASSSPAPTSLYGEWLRRERRRAGRPRAAAHRARDVHEHGHRGVRRARRARAAGDRRDASANAPSRRATSSPPRRPRSRDWPATASRTPRSARGCSSASTPSPTTYARSSPSSASPRATSSAACCPRVRSDAVGVTKSRHPAPIAVAIALAGKQARTRRGPNRRQAAALGQSRWKRVIGY